MAQFQRHTGAPSWVWWTSLTVAGLVIVIPLALLSLAGLLVGAMLFAILWLLATILRIARNALHWLRWTVTRKDDHGRRNVKVMPRDPSDFQ